MKSFLRLPKYAAYLLLAVFSALLFTPNERSYAQSTNAVVSGTVSSTDGERLLGANVVLRNTSTGQQFGMQSGTDGRFQFNQVPLGGPYVLEVRFVGFGAVERRGFEVNLGDQIRFDIELDEAVQELESIVVRPDDTIIQRASPLGATTRLSNQDLQSLPAASRSFQELASLSPLSGVGSSISIGGSRPSSTGITLDGANQRFMMNGGLISEITVSMEAIREYDVSSNNYNVLEGRQGGGSINVITNAGTNETRGSLFFYNRNESLAASENYLGQPLTDFNINQYGFSVGGPVIEDRLHYFVAMDFENRSEPFSVIDLGGGEFERREQISTENMDRMLNILGDQYGVDLNNQQVGRFNRSPLNRTIFARFDWQISDRHTLTSRNNFLWGESEAVVGGDAASIREAVGDITIASNSNLLALRSNFENLTNTLSVQYQRTQRNFPALAFAPRGFVNVQSELEDGTQVNRNFQFGGNRIAPEEQGEQQLQIVNQSYLRADQYLFTFGFDNLITFTNTLNTNEQGGLFRFASLDDLENRNPFQYQRLAPVNPDGRYAPRLRQTAFDLAAFAQVEFQPLPHVDLLAGIRWDGTLFTTRPEANPDVEEAFGRRTDQIARDLNNFQPRLQLTWDVGGRQRSFLRAGGGAYSANIVHWAQLSNMLQTGTVLQEVNLTGSDVPTPDYESYRNDPSTVPGADLADGGIPYINLVGADFRSPTTWKANIAYRQFFLNRFWAGINLYGSRTVNNYVYRDLNLNNEFAFTLANEQNRGVYAPVDEIQMFNGGVIEYPIQQESVSQNPEFGRVLELNGESDIWQRGLILEAGMNLSRGGNISFSYTLNQTEDNNSYNCCIARTSTINWVVDDPNDFSNLRGGSNDDFRHKVVVYGSSPEIYGFRLSARYVGQSGNPWTPLVFGDITGAGVGNQVSISNRAMIFDPQTIQSNPDATPFEMGVAAGMENVMANPDNTGSSYISNNLGQIAGRNEIYTPWWHNVDMRLSYSLSDRIIPGIGRNRLTVIADIFNVGNLINSDWGAQETVAFGNRVLLFNLGLDPVALQQGRPQYAYAVNETFGETTKANRPYQVQIGVRYEF